MKYKIAAIDLDGTLLHSETHRVTKGNADGIARALAAGIKIVLASGRQHETIAAFAAELRLPPDTPLISYNGALVRTLEGTTIFHRPLPPDTATNIVRFCSEQNYHLNYYLNDLLYVREDTSWARLYQRRTGSVPRIIHDLTSFDGSAPTKLLLIDTPDTTSRLLRHFQNEFEDRLYITKTEDEYLEFMNSGVNKAIALQHAASALSAAREECVAIGDSYNDIPMLKWAGLGVAMSSGKPEAIKAADQTAPDADDDGVASVLDKIISTN